MGIPAAVGAAPTVASGRSYYLAAVGEMLHAWHLDPRTTSLEPTARLALPEPVQYAWRHPHLPLLYVAFANRRNPDVGSGIGVVRIAPDGGLSTAFEPVPLPHRPIHLSTSTDGRHLLVAYNEPSGVTVHPLSADGRPGAAIAQHARLDGGVYAHQVRMAPDGRTVLLVTRGNDATDRAPEDPGAIKRFEMAGGQLRDERSIAPHGGLGFGPRHLDFHPGRPWVYVSMERENELQLFTLAHGRLSAEPRFVKSTLADPGARHPRQLAAAVHVSADGRFVYVANRADARQDDGQGHQVFVGGTNDIAVFRIDPGTGEPTLVQNIGTQSFNPRTFGIDASGTMLVATSIAPMLVREHGGVARVPAALTAYRIRPDGQLVYVRRIDVPTEGGRTMFWSGMVQA